jgi:hypothetical protein
VTIKNRSGKAGPSYINLYIDDSLAGHEEVSGMGPDAAVIKTFTWTARAGSHTMRAVADGDNSVAESDESNNEKTVTVSVSAPPETTTAPAPPSSPAPASDGGHEQPEAGVSTQNQNSEVQDGQNKAESAAKAPPEGYLAALAAAAKEIWVGWWFIAGGALFSCMAAIVLLRLRARQGAQ